MLVKVNDKVISICSDGRLAITSRGAKMLGMSFPLISGWKKRMMGRVLDIPDAMLTEPQRAELAIYGRVDGPDPRPNGWKPANPAAKIPLRPVESVDVCRACNALRAAGVAVTFDVAADVLAVESLRSGKVTSLRGCDLNDEPTPPSTPMPPSPAIEPLPSGDGLRVTFVDGALQVVSERTGKVTRMSVQALHGLAKRAG
jgi:hypothetical protein